MIGEMSKADLAQKNVEFHAARIENLCRYHKLSIEHGSDGTLQLVKYYNDEDGEFCKVSTQLNIVPSEGDL